MNTDLKRIGTVGDCGLNFSVKFPADNVVYKIHENLKPYQAIYCIENTKTQEVRVGTQHESHLRVGIIAGTVSMQDLKNRLQDMESTYTVYDPARLDAQIKEVLGDQYPLRTSHTRMGVLSPITSLNPLTTDLKFTRATMGLLEPGYPLVVTIKDDEMLVVLDCVREKTRLYEGSSVAEALQAYLDHKKR